MNFEIDEIKIISGQFQILEPMLNPNAPKEDQTNKGTLTVGCKFALMNSGEPIAEGVASNVPHATGTQIKLSEATLRAFSEFFNSLEHDIGNALSTTKQEKKEAARGNLLAELMGPRSGR